MCYSSDVTSAVKAAAPVWEEYRPVDPTSAPRARTGHVCITYNDKIFVYVPLGTSMA